MTKDVVVQVRVTGFAARLLRRAAAAQGKSVSCWLRELIYGASGVKEKIGAQE